MATTGTVTVYWRPSCPWCVILRHRLRKQRLPVTEVNIWTDPEAAAAVRAITGGDETVPTVVVAGTAMVNPSARQVREMVADRAPELLPPGRMTESPWRRLRTWLSARTGR